MSNIKFEYLFRDENNYKEYGEVILSNRSNLPLEIIKEHIFNNLIEEIWFNPDKLGVPKFSFHRISFFGLNDHVWYEFVDVTETNEITTVLKGIEELNFNAE